MNKIVNTFLEGKPLSEKYDTLIPEKIEVLKCVSHADCSYTETVRLSFYIGTQDGVMPYLSPKQIIELDIETGYLPVETVENELRTLLSDFKIFKFEKFLEAFKYRRYFCNY